MGREEYIVSVISWKYFVKAGFFINTSILDQNIRENKRGINGGSSGFFEEWQEIKIVCSAITHRDCQSVVLLMWIGGPCVASVHYELTAIIKTLVFVAPLRVASPRLCIRGMLYSASF